MFAVITPALISGAVADRIKFAAWAIFVPLWVLLVYCPVSFWIYGGVGSPVARRRGSLDFAGGTVIHVNAGIAALAAVLVLGKRKGWPKEGHPPHSMPLVMIGTGILWLGWFGFNAGSAFAANGTAIQAFINTFLAAAAAGIAWAIIERIKDGHFTNLGVASGIVAGLVAITPGAGFVSGMSPICIGLIAGVDLLLRRRPEVQGRLRRQPRRRRRPLRRRPRRLAAHRLLRRPGVLRRHVQATGLFYGGGLSCSSSRCSPTASRSSSRSCVTFAIVQAMSRHDGHPGADEDEVMGLDLSEHSEVAYHDADLGISGSGGRV